MDFRGDTKPIYSVYFLRDPRNFQVRYIGMTCAPKVRLSNHKSTGSAGDKPTPRKLAWMNELRSLGLEPVMQVVLTNLTKLRALRVEARLIFLHSQMNREQLCNLHMDASRSVGSFGPSYIYVTVECCQCGNSLRRQNDSVPPHWTRNDHGQPVCVRCKRANERLPFACTNASLGLLPQ